MGFPVVSLAAKTDITLQMHGLGSVISVIVPPLIARAISCG